MDHSLAVSILESVVKDSKVFQGVLISQNCLPIVKQRVALARYLHLLGDALVDTPHQQDLFSDAPKVDQGKAGHFVECPTCHEQQPDGGPNCFCRNCGVGPLPTNMNVTAEIVHKALVEAATKGGNITATANDDADVDVIANWSMKEREQALTWARDVLALDAGEEMPAMPFHVKDEMSTEALSDTDISLMLIEQGLVEELDTIAEWSWGEKREVISFCFEKRRTGQGIIPEFVPCRPVSTDVSASEDIPFIHADGTQTVSADDRLRIVKMDSFDANDCAVALAHDDKTGYLQKTIREAISRKLSRLKKEEAEAAAADQN